MIWRDVPGYEGRYQVSDTGLVRSLDRVDSYGRRRKGQLLRPGPQKRGHLTVSLGRHNSKQVHSLVLLAFEGPCPEGHEVLHKDHNPQNNNWNNLKYGTRSENLLMDYAAGRRTVPLEWVYSKNGKRRSDWKSYAVT